MSNLEEKIKSIIEKITKVLLDKMVSEEIDEEEGREMARYILEEKRKVVDEVSFNQFLKNLSERYPLFTFVIDNFQKEEKVNTVDQEKLAEIKSQLSKFIAN